MDEQELRKQGYIRIDQFCRAVDTWAQVCQQELESDYDLRRSWRKEFREHWAFIRLAIAKSCLLDRLIYGGETLREKICPIHKGHWSGCSLEGKKCDCAHDSCITGWLQNPGDPKSDASFRLMLVKDFKQDIKVLAELLTKNLVCLGCAPAQVLIREQIDALLLARRSLLIRGE